jgi:3-oxoacyl-[acyl-carrier protein] reductase
MDLNLKQKVILVSGGSEGIGFATAKTLAEEGAIVMIGSRSQEKLNHAKQQLSAFGDQIIIKPLDVTNPENIQAWVATAVAQFGRIDGLLINAGGPKPSQFEQLTEADWQTGFELILMSAIRMIYAVLPIMKQQQQGSIVAITSSAVKEPISELVLSNVFRTGLTALLKTLSRDLAQYQIRVNSVLPGRIDTERIKKLDESRAQQTGISITQIQQATLQNIPLGRLGNPDEMGKVATFLLSEAASYITGQAILVDGGLLKGL